MISGPHSVEQFARVSRHGSVLATNQEEIELDRIIKEFFRSTKTPQYAKGKLNLFSIPGMEKYAFFDYYLRLDIAGKIKFLKNNLDFKKIKEGAQNDDDLQDFLELYDDGNGQADAVVKLFEGIFLEHYSWDFVNNQVVENSYGLVDFKLKEEFKDEYLLYHN